MIKYSDIKRLHIELSSACNAACPTCPRNIDGGYALPWMNIVTMSFDDFTKIFPFDLLVNIDFILLCGNYGDPIFCKDLPDIIQYIVDINPYTRIQVHTNGSVRDVSWWEKIATISEKLAVVFSIDGLEDTNHIYRRGVCWDNVMRNAKAFISAGGTAIWEYLIFEHNEGQLEKARELSSSLGFSEFRPKRPLGFESSPVIKVVNNSGIFEYFIHEATNKSFQHKKMVSMNEHALQESNTPVYKNLRDISELLELRDMDNDDVYDSKCIDCMSSRNKEIYVDSSGMVHPCCFLGHISNVAFNSDTEQFRKWFETRFNYYDMNAKNRSIKDILESDYFNQIEDNWNLTISEGKLRTCAKMCSRDINAKDNIRVENE